MFCVSAHRLKRLQHICCLVYGVLIEICNELDLDKNIKKLVERPVFSKNEFRVLEAVKTNFELAKTSFDIRKRRSC